MALQYPQCTSLEPPAKRMVFLPQMTTSLPSTSADFRRVIWTGLYSQVVLMNVPVGGDIGDEVHAVDQILTFTAGEGLAIVAGEERSVQAGDVVIVPAGTRHQFLNVGNVPLLLYTKYSPAEHKPTTIHEDKAKGEHEEDEGLDLPPQWALRSKEENELLRVSKTETSS